MDLKNILKSKYCQIRKVCTVVYDMYTFHLHEIQEQPELIYLNRRHNNFYLWEAQKLTEKEQKKLSGVVRMFYISTGIFVARAYTLVNCSLMCAFVVCMLKLNKISL